MVSTPEAPDPKETAAAQAGMNRDTATTQQLLNMTNQVGPNGSLTYNQTGTNSFVGADGKTVTLPQFTATTTLSDAQKAIKDQTDAASLNLGTIANQQSAFLRDYLGRPVDMSAANVDRYVSDHFSDDFNKQWATQGDALATKLADQGIKLGSAAYDRAMNDFSTNRSNAYDNMKGNLYQTGLTALLQERNQPLNEISALLGGSQVSMPQFQQTPQTGVGGVDYTGLVNQKYQADVAKANASMGGLFGLLAAPFGMFSFGA